MLGLSLFARGESSSSYDSKKLMIFPSTSIHIKPFLRRYLRSKLSPSHRGCICFFFLLLLWIKFMLILKIFSFCQLSPYVVWLCKNLLAMFSEKRAFTSSVFLTPDLLHIYVYKSYQIESFCTVYWVSFMLFPYYHSRRSSYLCHLYLIAHMFSRNLDPEDGKLRGNYKIRFNHNDFTCVTWLDFSSLPIFVLFCFWFLQNLPQLSSDQNSTSLSKYQCY